MYKQGNSKSLFLKDWEKIKPSNSIKIKVVQVYNIVKNHYLNAPTTEERITSRSNKRLVCILCNQ